MAVLVTGASGFVGCTLVEELARAGEAVVAADLAEPPAGFPNEIAKQGGSVVFARVDVTDPTSIADLLDTQAFTQVIHGVAITASPAREAAEPSRIVEVNVQGTANLLHALQDRQVERFVQVSSSAAYGEAVFAVDILEEDAVCCDPRSMYDITKFACERVALRLGEIYGIDVRVGRLSTVFGAWERLTGVNDFPSPMFFLLLAALRQETAILSRPIYRDWIYSRDAAAGLIALAGLSDPQAPRIFNIGPGPDNRWPVLEWGQKLEGWFKGFHCRIAAPGETPNIALRQSKDRAPFSIERILAHTSFRPRFDIDAALEDFRAWFDGPGAGVIMAALDDAKRPASEGRSNPIRDGDRFLGHR